MPKQSPSSHIIEALVEARKAFAMDEVPVGAVLVHDGAIVARAANLKEKNQDPFGHAEMLVMRAAAEKLGTWRLEDCELYVTLEPCPMCMAAMVHARVKRVVYGARDPKGGAVSLGYELHRDARLNHRFEAELIETPECGEILTEFFRAKRSS